MENLSAVRATPYYRESSLTSKGDIHEPNQLTPVGRAVQPAAVALLLAACSQPAVPAIWTGTSVSAETGESRPLRLEVHEAAETWRGVYFVGAARGLIDGRISGTHLAAVLQPSSDCTFDLTGVVDGDALTASFVPQECPGGVAGTWELVRR